MSIFRSTLLCVAVSPRITLLRCKDLTELSGLCIRKLIHHTWALAALAELSGIRVWHSLLLFFFFFLFACPRLLLRIPLYSFSVVLVDKHGMDKERYVSLVTPVTLFNLIDTFPLRKEEMVLQAEMGQTCNTWYAVSLSVGPLLFLHGTTCRGRPGKYPWCTDFYL